MEIPPPVAHFHPTSIYGRIKTSVQPDKTTVLHGLSGSGKTQICVRLALEYKGFETNRVFFINATTLDSQKNDIAEISTKLSLDLNFSSKQLLAHLIGALHSSVPGDCRLYLILNDIEDGEVLKNVLENLNTASIQKQLERTCVIVTSQVKPGKEHQSVQCIHVKGFSREEAKEYLEVQSSSSESRFQAMDGKLDEVLRSISKLPAALNAFKQDYYSNRLTNNEEYINKYLREMELNVGKNKALNSIKLCLERAFTGRPLLQRILKHLCMFNKNNITLELMEALIEELSSSQGDESADSVADILVTRSFGNILESDTRRKYITLHTLVKKAIDGMVTDEERPDIFRMSLQAFCRIIPRDGRHHQNDVVPKVLEHALCILNSYDSVKNRISSLTKLLFAELHTGIGYCMMSYKLSSQDVIKKLDSGTKLFLELFFGRKYNSENFEADIDTDLQTEEGRKMFMPTDDRPSYDAYVKTLQLMHRLSKRDFEFLFYQTEKLYLYKTSDHLTDRGLEELRGKDYLLDLKTLAEIYPLELFAQHLHLLSKLYGSSEKEDGDSAPGVRECDDQRMSYKISQKADAIYNSIKKHCGVTLLGLYINKRFLYNIRAKLNLQGDLETLCREWEDLRKRPSGYVYECGIVRSKEMSEDDYHQLICYEGELLVYGTIAKHSDPATKKDMVISGERLVEEIDKLCRTHQKPHITRSRAYIAVCKFYRLCADYQRAISYSVTSMIEYHYDCREKQKIAQGHPELDDDKRNKFIDGYKQLEKCINCYQDSRDQQPGPIGLTDGEKAYLDSVYMAWQTKCASNIEGGDKRFDAIDKVLQLIKQEVTQVSS